MSKPIVKSGKFHAGADCIIGENVIIDVAEETVLGDRCTLGDNTYLCGRSIKVGDDFYGYSHWNKRLEVGLGRRSEEDAVLTVGSRCTFHDNKIDLARRVTVGDDVGLSPEVTIYTHGYWMSVLDGFPRAFASVVIGDGVIVGYRSTILAGAGVANECVVGAGSVVTKTLWMEGAIYGGVPAKAIGKVKALNPRVQEELLAEVMDGYKESCAYRGINLDQLGRLSWVFPDVWCRGFKINVLSQTSEGEEDSFTDDLRWHLFTHGIRVYTKRRFQKLEKR